MKFTELSPQQLVDCDTRNKGCRGGWYSKSFRYGQENGFVSEADYVYTATKDTCRFEKPDPNCPSNKLKCHVKMDKFTYCMGTPNYSNGCSRKKLKTEFLNRGPYAAAFKCNFDCQLYSSGILNYRCSGVNHGVIVVAITKDYLKFRNSWGSNYGENGYARMKLRDSDQTCSFEKYAWQPTYIKPCDQ